MSPALARAHSVVSTRPSPPVRRTSETPLTNSMKIRWQITGPASWRASVGGALKETIQAIVSKFEDHAFDLRYGTNTAQRLDLKDLHIISENKSRGVNYMPTHSKPFRKLVRELDLPRDKVFVDLGSGKGKVLILAAQCGFKRVVGVEFSRDLCLDARKNVVTFQRRARIKIDAAIVESDAVDYAIKIR